MDVPNWLIEILRQFPMVVVIGFAIWYMEKRTREKEIRLEARYDQNWRDEADRADKVRTEIREDRDAEIKRFLDNQKIASRVQEKSIAVKDERIAQLTDEVEKLRKELAALTKKLLG